MENSLTLRPFALIGTWLGTWSLSKIHTKAISLLVAMFLISTPFQYNFGKKEKSFEMKLQWFAPLGFIASYLSALIGATGPIENPFYFNYGIML